MNWPAISILLLVTFAASWVLIELFRKWSIRRQLFDIPNERSSHSTPTPRGGGLVIVAVCLSGYVVISQLFGQPFSWGYFAGALLVAGISWLDDLRSLPFWSRLLVHVTGAVLVVADLGAFTSIPVPLVASDLALGPLTGSLLTACWIVWLINAYNFMDGIDGIAGLQAAIAAAAWVAIGAWSGSPVSALFPAVLLFASVAFLIHNWQPAKIFMGDVGSAFLGFTLASLPLLLTGASDEGTRRLLPLLGVAFVWFFVFDTVVTMIKRAMLGQKIWQPHREHLYQALVIAGWPHASVTLLYGALATILAVLAVMATLFSGIFTTSAILFLLVSTLALSYLGRLKKR